MFNHERLFKLLVIIVIISKSSACDGFKARYHSINEKLFLKVKLNSEIVGNPISIDGRFTCNLVGPTKSYLIIRSDGFFGGRV